ncbi:DUF805 domain-containing protein [Pedobacter immunditicola]|uniref:DUF805 domain-containing protein n=1 Tax=Pedobacter immunditicola TaxID=3133440 RepID=UPI00309896C8
MKKYFYVKDSQRFGPITIEDLKKVNITKETLVWFDGLTEWKAAIEIPDLEDLFIVQVVSHSTSIEVNKNNDLLIPKTEDLRRTVPQFIQEQSDENRLVKSEYDDSAQVDEQNTPVDDFNETIPTNPKQRMFASPFSFNGRIRRTEYWLTFVAVNLLFFVVEAMGGGSSSGDNNLLIFIIFIPAFWLMIAQNAKRCHDRGNSGWFQIIPFYGLWMAFAGGDPFGNEYGPNPKGQNY